MNKTLLFLIYLLVTAGVTYLVRVIPLVLFKRKIKNRFLRSFLYYVPYSVLAVMTVPSIIFSTSYVTSGILGALAAGLLAARKKSLVTVAAGAALTVLIVELIIPYLPVALI